MQQMQFPKIAAILEGGMERAFVNSNFDYVHVMPISNGITWTVPAMIKQIETLVGALAYNPDLVIVWFDREKRAESADEIAQAVVNALSPTTIAQEKLVVVVCDQMTENLFLLDGALLAKEGIAEEAMPASIGRNGKTVIKELYKAKGRKYTETFDGVRMLKSLNLQACGQHYPQADILKAALPACWWG